MTHVFLLEPSPTRADLHFRLFGIPVRVNPMFWVIALMLGYRSEQPPVELLIWIGAIFVSILIHEMGHALAARAYGWQPWITLYSMGGLASYRPTHDDFRSKVLISAAGPAAGFLFIAVVMAMVQAFNHPVHVAEATPIPYWVFFRPFESQKLNELVKDLLLINIFWGLVNLLPVFPLDGGQIAQAVMVQRDPRDGVRQSLWLSVIAAIAVAAAGALFLHDMYLAIFFGLMAYSSYSALQQLGGRGGYGGGP